MSKGSDGTEVRKSNSAIDTVKQLDKQLQTWTNEMISSDVFLYRVTGYFVKGPVELLLAFLVAGVVITVGYLVVEFSFSYQIQTKQLLTVSVPSSLAVYTKGAYCELSKSTPSRSDQKPKESKTKREEGTDEEKSDKRPEIEA